MKNLHLIPISNREFAVWNSLTLRIAYGNEKLKRIYEQISGNETDFGTNSALVQKLRSERVILSNNEADEIVHLLKENLEKDNKATLYLLPTLRCNLSCNYCIVNALARLNFYEELDMKDEEITDIISSFFTLTSHIERKREFVVLGGEPLLAPDKVELIGRTIRMNDEYFNTDSNIYVVTNGTLITDKSADIIKRFNIFPIISIDGKKEENAAGRCECDIDDSIQKLKVRNISYALSITIGKHNIDSLEKNVTYLVEKYEPLEIGLNGYLHSMPFSHPNSYEVTGEDVVRRITSLYEPMAKKGIFIEQFMRRIRPFVEEAPRLKECPACGNKIVALPEGVVGRCEYFCLNKKHLLDRHNLEYSLEASDRIWRNLSPLNWNDCANCECKCICGGGCRYDGFCATGSLERQDRKRCEQERLILNWIVRKIHNVLGLRNAVLYIPTVNEKRKLYFNINVGDEKMPLQLSSRAGEISYERD